MGVAQILALLALRPLFDAACTAAGVDPKAAAQVLRLLHQHLADPSRHLPDALTRANRRAWRALELALDADSWLGWCKRKLAAVDERALA